MPSICDEKTETVNHLIGGCKVLGGKEYKDRFENVARTIHWQLCRKHQIECNADNLWDHVREKVVERENIKIFWDFNVYADRKIKGKRPNIIVIDEMKKKVKLIDISAPTDHWIDEKEMEKIDKYQDLKIEIERLWSVKTMMVPIVIGLLGTISKQFNDHVQRLDLGSMSLLDLQKSVILCTAHILRRGLQLSGTRWNLEL